MSRGFKNRMKVAGAVVFILVSVIALVIKDADPWVPIDDLPRKAGDYAESYRFITVPIGEDNSGYAPGYRQTELSGMKKSRSYLKSGFSDTLRWYSRGPVNVGGRTRCVLVDPDDPTQNTWYAGTAGGGIWKTVDAGQSWIDLTPELPNLATVALCMAPGNHNVIYAGTGEGFGGIGMITGDGIFRTDDRGATWSRIESTLHEVFYYVNDIIVDPDDENTLVVATNRGIYRSENAGADWDTVFQAGSPVQDLVVNPGDSATIFAGVNTYGVIRSYDMGRTWSRAGEGMKDFRRISLAISPADTNWIYASAEMRDGDMNVFVSTDAGESWTRNSKDDAFFNFHGAQGWYNNTITADPYLKNKAYVGGVYIGALTFSEETSWSDPEVLSADTTGTARFLDFINFGGAFLGGGMSTGLDEEAQVTIDDFVSVELRFGPGMSQKAHRFQVPEGEGPGVPETDYTYYDYVDVPFIAWDVTNNRQLMVSFRDQERDGLFNLIERDPDDPIPGREYIFIHAVPYDAAAPDPDIAVAGGHYYKMMYFFWPTLSAGGLWDVAQIAESRIAIEFGTYLLQLAETEVVSSTSRNVNLHVDHHHLVILPGASESDNHTIISANDGGVAVSVNSGNTWEQLTNGFYTTQFYGVAKKPGKDVFIGGMQDNGTWRSPLKRVATETVPYATMLGGDGFETLWHPTREDEILASVYNNRIYKSFNGGGTWELANAGIGEEGPFITKLSHSRQTPDTVYAVDATGLYRHTLFATRIPWKHIPVEEGEGLDYYGSASGYIDVEVSDADPGIIWFGQGMFETPLLNIFISEDHGDTYRPVQQYSETEMGFISAIETHPTDPDVAYLLFAYKGKPKILRTGDKGGSWEDISGFGTDSTSNNGFPDVPVLSLLVMPHNPDVIWAGTEIGIVESLDNGASWHLLDSEFPNVSVFQMLYQDSLIVIATHGRGIWTAGANEVTDGIYEEEGGGNSIVQRYFTGNLKIGVYPNPADEFISVSIKGGTPGSVALRLYTMSGQLVRTEKYDLIMPGQLLKMNISEHAPGNYVLTVSNGENTRSENVVIR